MDKPVDVLVIGAGISGLAFASTYLSAHPCAELLVVEKEAVVGGTWNRRRLYDHFYTQGSFGYFEFANFRMAVPPEEDQYCGLYNAKHLANYLEKFAEHQTFAGRPLKDRIHFSTLVLNAQKKSQDGSWVVEVQNLPDSERRNIFARKLVIASGLTSVPNIPRLQGRERFTGRIIHHMDFGSSAVLSDSHVKHITVLGGGKSGADMAYACVKAGKTVAWIVRPSGTGPCTFVDANGKAGYKNATELAATRAIEALQPSHFGADDWWSYFFHRTSIGLFLANKLWSGAHAGVIASADYPNRPSRGDFNKLVPHTPLFWRNNPAGILNHEDFYDVMAGSVVSYYDELKDLEGDEIRLESGRSIHTDVILLGTGWRSSLGYLSPLSRAELGLPYPLEAESQFDPARITASREWVEREEKADADVIAKFPILAHPPEHVRLPFTDAPYRLYNLVVPVDDPTRSIAVIGNLLTTNYFRTGEAQSRWVTAYFDGQLCLPPVNERKDEVAHVVAWCRRRYLSSGNAGNSLDFDTLRYTDRLFAQLGLTSHLKTGWAYIFSPSRAEDYAGLAREFTARYGDGNTSTEVQEAVM